MYRKGNKLLGQRGQELEVRLLHVQEPLQPKKENKKHLTDSPETLRALISAWNLVYRR
jgi:hypothetical protein